MNDEIINVMSKEGKHIKKALESLGWSDPNGRFKSFQDIKDIISEFKTVKETCLNQIDVLKENIEICDNQIESLTEILNQSEIEEFRAMNPNAKAVYKF